jgi:serine/threonine protein kinase
LLAHIGIEICAALQYLHEAQASHGSPGYLHRGLEPENLMVTGAGAVKIIDFGAARPAPGGGEGRPFGRKLRYASPEVAQGTAEDRRGDIYSLGVVLYELITGVPAFDGDSLAIVSRIVEGKPRPARALVPALPDRLATIVDRAMARRREDRFATADALSLGLQDFIAHAPSPAERGQSIKDALRSLFDGLSLAPWREALAISRRPRSPAKELPAVPPSIEAAWCFDQGLAFISDRKHAEALAEWQRAVELDPLNRLYQTNLNRLRGQIDSKSPGPFPTLATPEPVAVDAAAVDGPLVNLLGLC